VAEGMHFRFCETPPDIRMCREAERCLARLRTVVGYAVPCVVCVTEAQAGSPERAFHVRVDCDFGRGGGVVSGHAVAQLGVEAVARAFGRLERRLLPRPAVLFAGGRSPCALH